MQFTFKILFVPLSNFLRTLYFIMLQIILEDSSVKHSEGSQIVIIR